MATQQKILQHARSLAEGSVLSPKKYAHLGSRKTIGKAFARLANAGGLLRVTRGNYVVPVTNKFGTRPPAPAIVVRNLAEELNEIVVPHGASAANVLGLTRQVPIREVYLTSGRTRNLTLGNSVVSLKHAPKWMLALGTRPAGAAVRALAWLGTSHSEEAVATLHQTLPPAEWRALIEAKALPRWMARAIVRETHG